MRTTLLSFFLLCGSFMQAQTYFYINTISVEPASPTTDDAITISLQGDLSSSGAYIVSASHMLMGNIVHITVIAADLGGLDVLVPHTEVVEIGPLPAGSYGILVDGSFILDSAPEFQHSFNVSEGGGTNCDGITIASIQWAPFSSTTLLVHVTSTPDEFFNYPAFVLLDENGDTLAKETTNFKGLPEDSWHPLEIHEDAQVPSGAFNGTLHLWTNFYNDFACAWELPVDLCPATECTILEPYIINLGDALAIGTFQWSISNDALTASGQFVLTAEVQAAQAEVCLPPGEYDFTVMAQQPPTGGQVYFGVDAIAGTAGLQQPFMPDNSSMTIPLFMPCSDSGNGITEPSRTTDLTITTNNGTISVQRQDGNALGELLLCDALGKIVARTMTSNATAYLDVAQAGIYLLRTSGETRRIVVSGH